MCRNLGLCRHSSSCFNTIFHTHLFKKNIYLFFGCTGSSWLCGVFVAAHGLSLVIMSGSYSLVVVLGLLTVVVRLLLLWSLGSRHAGLVAAHELSFLEACGIFLDQGSNP